MCLFLYVNTHYYLSIFFFSFHPTILPFLNIRLSTLSAHVFACLFVLVLFCLKFTCLVFLHVCLPYLHPPAASLPICMSPWKLVCLLISLLIYQYFTVYYSGVLSSDSVFLNMLLKLRMYSTVKCRIPEYLLAAFLSTWLWIFVHNIHFNNSFSDINFFFHYQVFELLKSEVTSSQWCPTLWTCSWRSSEENVNTIKTPMKNKMNNTVPKTGLANNTLNVPDCLLPYDFTC